MKKFLWCCLFLPLAAFSQVPYFKAVLLNRENPALSINQVAFASNGFLWAATSEGLYRSDGIEHQLFLIDSLKGIQAATCLYEDKQGVIWAGYKNGLIANIQGDSIRILNSKEGFPKKAITSINADIHGALWFTTAGEGVYFYSNNRFYNINSDDGLNDDYCYTSAPDGAGNMWIGTDQGLALCTSNIHQKVIRQVRTANGLPDEIIRKIVMSDTMMYVGTQEKGVWAMSIRNFSVYNLFPDNFWKYGAINDMMKNNNTGELWIASESGGILYQYKSGERLQSYTTFDKFKFGVANSIAADLQGNVWMATSAGLFRSHGMWLTFLNRLNDIEIKDVHELTFLKDGRIVFSERNLLRMLSAEDNTLKTIEIPITRSNIGISGLYADDAGYLWVGTLGDGLYRINPDTKQILRIKIPENYTSILSIAGIKDQIWLGTFGGALCIHLAERNTSNPAYTITEYAHQKELGNYSVYVVYVDAKNRIWFGTDQNGIVYFENGAFHIPSNGVFNGKTVYSITGDSLGNIWFTMADEGLVLWNNQEFKIFNRLQGIRELNITSVAVLTSDRLAIVHKRGIDILNYRNQTVMYLGADNNLDNLNPEINSSTTDSKGRWWFGSEKGLVVLNPILLKHDPTPKLSNLQLITGAGIMASATQHTFSYQNNTLTFEYAATWFTNPNRILYQYKLDGLNKEWIDTRDKKQVFPNLAPGNYTFRIRAAIDRTFTNADEKTFSFVVEKPFWRTNWFYVITTLTSLAIIYWLLHERDKRVKRYQQLRNEAIRFQFETLRNQVNPHFLFNSFNTLISLIEENKDMAVEYVEKLSEFFRNIVNFKDKNTITVGEELKIASAYFFLQQKRYSGNLILEVNEAGVYTDFRVVPMVLQMLLENAIKHNEVSSLHKLTLSIAFDAERIVVRNNINQKRHKEESTGTGLQNIKDRYRLLTDKAVIIENHEKEFIVSLPLLYPEK